MITDPKGRMIVGQFGSYVNKMLKLSRSSISSLATSSCKATHTSARGAISHINDWMVLVPVFHQGDLVGFASMFGHMMDVGGAVPGSMPTGCNVDLRRRSPHSADQALPARRGQ